MFTLKGQLTACFLPVLPGPAAHTSTTQQTCQRLNASQHTLTSYLSQSSSLYYVDSLGARPASEFHTAFRRARVPCVPFFCVVCSNYLGSPPSPVLHLWPPLLPRKALLSYRKPQPLTLTSNFTHHSPSPFCSNHAGLQAFLNNKHLPTLQPLFLLLPLFSISSQTVSSFLPCRHT